MISIEFSYTLGRQHVEDANFVLGFGLDWIRRVCTETFPHFDFPQNIFPECLDLPFRAGVHIILVLVFMRRVSQESSCSSSAMSHGQSARIPENGHYSVELAESITLSLESSR